MRCKLVLVLLLLFLFINLASAEFNFSQSGSSINTQYGPSDSLKAKINISFQNESLNSTFIDSLGNSIILNNLLKIIPNFNYTLNYTNTTINSGFHVIQFDAANFSMPGAVGNFTYQLNFSGKNLFLKEIKIISLNNTAGEEIENKYNMLNNSRIKINSYDLITKKILNEILNTTNLEKQINKVEEQYENASPGEYEGILQNLSEINVPEIIDETANADSINFYPEREIINLDILKTIAGGDYSPENETGFIDAIYLWNQDNLKTKITFDEISVIYDSGETTTIRIFQFEFDKREMKDEAYFIMEDLGDIKFEGNYYEQEEGGYIYINLNDVSDKIIFSTEQDIDFISAPAFMAPSLVDLTPAGVGQYIDTQKENKFSKWILFGLIIFLLLLIGIIAYISIQMWYRRRYENYLFKNRNNLFNIMTYIQNAKKKGMEREDIIENLKKAKWTREQINYALKKYEGKKIAGIIERPFKKVLENINKTP